MMYSLRASSHQRRSELIRFLIPALALIPAVVSAQERIDWASFPVERETFSATEVAPQRYSSAGVFDGVGMLYFSPSKRLVEIKRLQKISLPFPGQEPNDKYEFHPERIHHARVLAAVLVAISALGPSTRLHA